MSDPAEMAYYPDEESAKLPAAPPFDLNNFPFTFEQPCDTSRSINIEPDVRLPMAQRGGLYEINTN